LKQKIDINCDLGESYGAFTVGNDAKIMPYITSANIACGFHAGDPKTIANTINLAKKRKVAVGAHPSFPDIMGFGRREMQLTPEEAKDYIIYQVSAVQGFARAAGTGLQHVKPHGALYNMAVKDEELSRAIVEAVHALKDDLIVFAPPKSVLAKAASKAGLRVAHEFFADRAYNPDGSLVSRKQADAVIQEPRKVVERAIKAVKEETILAANGETLNIGEVHTICVHGDTPSAVRLAEALKKGLAKASVKVAPVGSFI
jgi:UPF0271 protein